MKRLRRGLADHEPILDADGDRADDRAVGNDRRAELHAEPVRGPLVDRHVSAPVDDRDAATIPDRHGSRVGRGDPGVLGVERVTGAECDSVQPPGAEAGDHPSSSPGRPSLSPSTNGRSPDPT